MKINLNKLVENNFKLDIVKNDKHTSLTQVCLLTIKSLVPSDIFVGNVINQRRFVEEVKLWRFYQDGNINMLSNAAINDSEISNYYDFDHYFYLRAFMIISSNKDYQVSEDEIIKNLLLTSGNINNLLLWVGLNRFIFLLNTYNDNEVIIEELKNYIIGFSQKDYFEKYKENYRVDYREYPGNYIIDFEKQKIKIINALNGVKDEAYMALYEVISLVEGNISRDEIKSLEAQIIVDVIEDDIILDKFYLNMINYVEKLRMSRIDPKNLVLENYDVPNVFGYNVKDKFYHALLGECVVIKKEVRNDILTSEINTKSGSYVFRAKIR